MAPPAPTDDAQTLAHLQEQIHQLTTAVQALALQQEEYINVQPQEKSDNEEDNPFAEHDENGLIIEQGFKYELPEFHGRHSAEGFLDWIVTVEDTLEFKRVSLERCVPMIEMRLSRSLVDATKGVACTFG